MTLGALVIAPSILIKTIKTYEAYPSGIDFCLYVPPPEPVSLEDDKLLGELRHCCDLAKAMEDTVT